MISATNSGVQTSESAKQAIEAFTGTKIPRGRRDGLLRDASALDQLADFVRNVLGPDLVQTIKAVRNSVDGQTAARFVAQTAPFVATTPAILIQVATLQNEVAEAMRGYAVEMDYLERQALIMFIFMMVELAIAAAEAFFAPEDAVERVATTRTIIQTVLRANITKMAARSLAIQMLFMPGSSLLAQLSQMADHIRTNVDWSEVGKQALYGLAVAAITTLAGPALGKGNKFFVNGLNKAGLNETWSERVAGWFTRPVTEISMEVGGGVGAAYIVDGKYDPGNARGDAISGAAEAGTGMAATHVGIGGRRGAKSLGFTPSLPHLKLPGGIGFSATGTPVLPLDDPPPPYSETADGPGPGDPSGVLTGKTPPPAALGSPDLPVPQLPSLVVPPLPVPDFAVATAALTQQWQEFQRGLLDSYGGVLSGVAQARQLLATLPIGQLFDGWVAERAGGPEVAGFLAQAGLPASTLDTRFLAGVRDQAVARMAEAVARSSPTPAQIVAGLPAEFDRQAARSAAQLAAQHRVDQYFAGPPDGSGTVAAPGGPRLVTAPGGSGAVAAPGGAGRPGGVPGPEGAAGSARLPAGAPAHAPVEVRPEVRAEVWRQVQEQVDRGLDAILGTSALPTVASRPGGAQLTAVANVVRQATGDLPGLVTQVSTVDLPTLGRPTVPAGIPTGPAGIPGMTPAGTPAAVPPSGQAGLAPATPAEFERHLPAAAAQARQQFTGLAGHLGADPVAHPALAASFEREWLDGYRQMFDPTATTAAPAVNGGTVEIDTERWRRIADPSGRAVEPFQISDGRMTRLPDSGERIAVRYAMTPSPDAWTFQVRLHLAGQPGADLVAVERAAKEGVATFLNAPGYVLPGAGVPMRVEVEFVTDPAQAHATVQVGAPGSDTNQVNWAPDATPATYAHEVLHFLGATDAARPQPGQPFAPSLMGRHSHSGTDLPVTDSDLRQIVDTLAPHHAGVAGSPGPLVRPAGAASAAVGPTSVAPFWDGGLDRPPEMNHHQAAQPPRMVRILADGYCMLYAFVASDPTAVRTALAGNLPADLDQYLADPARVRGDAELHAAIGITPAAPLRQVADRLRQHVATYLENAVANNSLPADVTAQRLHFMDDRRQEAATLDLDQVTRRLEELGVTHDPDTGIPVADMDPRDARELLVTTHSAAVGQLDSFEFAHLLDAVDNWSNRWETDAGEFFGPLLAHATRTRIGLIRQTAGGALQPIPGAHGEAGRPLVTLYHVAADPARPTRYNHFNASAPAPPAVQPGVQPGGPPAVQPGGPPAAGGSGVSGTQPATHPPAVQRPPARPAGPSADAPLVTMAKGLPGNLRLQRAVGATLLHSDTVAPPGISPRVPAPTGSGPAILLDPSVLDPDALADALKGMRAQDTTMAVLHWPPTERVAPDRVLEVSGRALGPKYSSALLSVPRSALTSPPRPGPRVVPLDADGQVTFFSGRPERYLFLPDVAGAPARPTPYGLVQRSPGVYDLGDGWVAWDAGTHLWIGPDAALANVRTALPDTGPWLAEPVVFLGWQQAPMPAGVRGRVGRMFAAMPAGAPSGLITSGIGLDRRTVDPADVAVPDGVTLSHVPGGLLAHAGPRPPAGATALRWSDLTDPGRPRLVLDGSVGDPAAVVNAVLATLPPGADLQVFVAPPGPPAAGTPGPAAAMAAAAQVADLRNQFGGRLELVLPVAVVGRQPAGVAGLIPVDARGRQTLPAAAHAWVVPGNSTAPAAPHPLGLRPLKGGGYRAGRGWTAREHNGVLLVTEGDAKPDTLPPGALDVPARGVAVVIQSRGRGPIPREVAATVDRVLTGVPEADRHVRVFGNAHSAGPAAPEPAPNPARPAQPDPRVLPLGNPKATLPAVARVMQALRTKANNRGVTVPAEKWESLRQELLNNYKRLATEDGYLVALGNMEVRAKLEPVDPRLETNPAGAFDTTARGESLDDKEGRAAVEDGRFHINQETEGEFQTGTKGEGDSTTARSTRLPLEAKGGIPLGPTLNPALKFSGVANRADQRTGYVVDAEKGRVLDTRADSTVYSYRPGWKLETRVGDETAWEQVGVPVDDSERLILAIPDHLLETSGEQVAAELPADQRGKLGRVPRRVFASNISGLVGLYDNIVARLRADGYDMSVDSRMRQELRRKLWNLDLHFDEAVNNKPPTPPAAPAVPAPPAVPPAPAAEARGYKFTLSDDEGEPVATIRVFADRQEGARRVGGTSDKAHIEGVRTGILGQSGEYTVMQSSGVSFGVSTDLPMHALPWVAETYKKWVKLGISGKVGATWNTNDGAGAVQASLNVVVSRYTGFTLGHEVPFQFAAEVGTFADPGAAPRRTAAVDGSAVLRMSEPDAFEHGFSVDEEAFAADPAAAQPPQPAVPGAAAPAAPRKVAYGPWRNRLRNIGPHPEDTGGNVLPEHVRLGRGLGQGLPDFDETAIARLRTSLGNLLRQHGFLPPDPDRLWMVSAPGPSRPAPATPEPPATAKAPVTAKVPVTAKAPATAKAPTTGGVVTGAPAATSAPATQNPPGTGSVPGGQPPGGQPPGTQPLVTQQPGTQPPMMVYPSGAVAGTGAPAGDPDSEPDTDSDSDASETRPLLRPGNPVREGYNAVVKRDRKGLIQNQDTFDKMISNDGLESHFDPLSQDAMTFTLHTWRNSVMRTAEVSVRVISRITDRVDAEGNSVHFVRLTDELHTVTLAMALGIAGQGAGGDQGFSAEGGFRLPMPEQVKVLESLGLIGGSVSRSLGASERLTRIVNRPELTEYSGRVALFDLPFDLEYTVKFNDLPNPVVGPRIPTTVRSAVLPLNTDPTVFSERDAGDTERSVLDRGVVYFLNTQGVRAAAQSQLPAELTRPGQPMAGPLYSLSSRIAIQAHLKEAMLGQYGTDTLVEPGFWANTNAALSIGVPRMRHARFVGATPDQYVAGLIELYLTETVNTASRSFAKSLNLPDFTLFRNFGPLKFEYSNAQSVKVSENESAETKRTGGLEMLKLAFNRAYAFEVRVDFQVRSGTHTQVGFLYDRVKVPTGGDVTDRTLLFLLPEAQALAEYAAGRLPVSQPQLLDAMTRWSRGELVLSGNTVAGVLTRWQRALAAPPAPAVPGAPAAPAVPALDAFLVQHRVRAFAQELATRHPDPKQRSAVVDQARITGFRDAFGIQLDPTVDPFSSLSIPPYLTRTGARTLGHTGIDELTLYQGPALPPGGAPRLTTTLLDAAHTHVDAVAPGLLGPSHGRWADARDNWRVLMFAPNLRVVGNLPGGIDSLQAILAGQRANATFADLLHQSNGVRFYLINRDGPVLSDLVELRLGATLDGHPRYVDWVPEYGIENYVHEYQGFAVNFARALGLNLTPAKFSFSADGKPFAGDFYFSAAPGGGHATKGGYQVTREQTTYDWSGHYLTEDGISVFVGARRLAMYLRGFTNFGQKLWTLANNAAADWAPASLAEFTELLRVENESSRTYLGKLTFMVPRGLAEAEPLPRSTGLDLRPLPTFPGDAYISGVLADDLYPAARKLMSDLLTSRADDPSYRGSIALSGLLGRVNVDNHLYDSLNRDGYLLGSHLFVAGASNNRAALRLYGSLHSMEVISKIVNATGTGRYAKFHLISAASQNRGRWRTNFGFDVSYGKPLGDTNVGGQESTTAKITFTASGNRNAPANQSATFEDVKRSETHGKMQGVVYLVRLRGRFHIGGVQHRHHMFSTDSGLGTFGPAKFRGAPSTGTVTGDVYAEMLADEVEDLRLALDTPHDWVGADIANWPAPAARARRFDIAELLELTTPAAMAAAPVAGRTIQAGDFDPSQAAPHAALLIRHRLDNNYAPVAPINLTVDATDQARRRYARVLTWAVDRLTAAAEPGVPAPALLAQLTGWQAQLAAVPAGAALPAGLPPALGPRTEQIIAQVRTLQPAGAPPLELPHEVQMLGHDPLDVARGVAFELGTHLDLTVTALDGTTSRYRINEDGWVLQLRRDGDGRYLIPTTDDVVDALPADLRARATAAGVRPARVYASLLTGTSVQMEAAAGLPDAVERAIRRARDDVDDRVRQWLAGGLPQVPGAPIPDIAVRDTPDGRAGRARRLLSAALGPGWTTTGPLRQVPPAPRPGTRLWIARPHGAFAAVVQADGSYRVLDTYHRGGERTVTAAAFQALAVNPQAVTVVEPGVLESWLLQHGNWAASRQFAQDNLAVLRADETARRFADDARQRLAALPAPPPGGVPAAPDPAARAIDQQTTLLDAFRGGQVTAPYDYLTADTPAARTTALTGALAAVVPTDPTAPTAPSGLRALARLVADNPAPAPAPPAAGAAPAPAAAPAPTDVAILRAVADILDPAVAPLDRLRSMADALRNTDPGAWRTAVGALAARLPAGSPVRADLAALETMLDPAVAGGYGHLNPMLTGLANGSAQTLSDAVDAAGAGAADLARVWRTVTDPANLAPTLPAPAAPAGPSTAPAGGPSGAWAGGSTTTTGRPTPATVSHRMPPASDTLDQWMAHGTDWDASRGFLNAHPQELLSDGTHSDLQIRRARQAGDPQTLAVGDGLLTLARYGWVADGYRYLEGQPPSSAAVGAPTGRQELLADLLSQPDLADAAAVGALANLAGALTGTTDQADAAVLRLAADFLAGLTVPDVQVTDVVRQSRQELSDEQRRVWSDALLGLSGRAIAARRPALRDLAHRLHIPAPAAPAAPATQAQDRQQARQRLQETARDLARAGADLATANIALSQAEGARDGARAALDAAGNTVRATQLELAGARSTVDRLTTAIPLLDQAANALEGQLPAARQAVATAPDPAAAQAQVDDLESRATQARQEHTDAVRERDAAVTLRDGLAARLPDEIRAHLDAGEQFHAQDVAVAANTAAVNGLATIRTAREAAHDAAQHEVDARALDVPRPAAALDVEAELADLAADGTGPAAVAPALADRLRRRFGDPLGGRVVLRTDPATQATASAAASADARSLFDLGRVRLAQDLAAALGTPVELRVGGTPAPRPYLAYPGGEVVRLDATGSPETALAAIGRLPQDLREALTPHLGDPQVRERLEVLHEAEIETQLDLSDGVRDLLDNANRFQGLLAYHWVTHNHPPVDPAAANPRAGLAIDYPTDLLPVPPTAPPVTPTDPTRPDLVAAAWLTYSPAERAAMMVGLLNTAAKLGYNVPPPTRVRPAVLPGNTRLLVVAGGTIAAGRFGPTGQVTWYEPGRNRVTTGSLAHLGNWAAQRAGNASDVWYIVLAPAAAPPAAPAVSAPGTGSGSGTGTGSGSGTGSGTAPGTGTAPAAGGGPASGSG